MSISDEDDLTFFGPVETERCEDCGKYKEDCDCNNEPEFYEEDFL